MQMEKQRVAGKCCKCLDGSTDPNHAILNSPIEGNYAVSQRCHDSFVSGGLPQDCRLYGMVNFNPVARNAFERISKGDTTLNDFGQEFASADEANAAEDF